MKKVFFIGLFFFILPTFTHAAVTINEIAWMGNTVSANDEWIELYNSGSQRVDLSGWRLSDGMNLDIELAGAVGAGQYAVLERTDDASALGTAFFIYTGGLVNSGATLSLYRPDNSLEDRVVGGKNWQNIGGDNVTKETAQYTSRGWITARSTPGESNMVNTGSDVIEVPVGQNTYTSDKDTIKEASSIPTLFFVPRELGVTILAPSTVYVNQEVSFTLQSEGLADGILQSLVHQWNFGDFTTTTGRKAQKRFAYPGEYVVTLHSQYKNYQADARQNITVLPVSFSITKSPQGNVQVHNNARYEVDVSGYKIAAGRTVTFPEGTILLPNATITIPKDTLKFTRNATLFDDTATQLATIVAISKSYQARTSQDVSQVSVDAPVVYAPLITAGDIIISTKPEFVFLEEEKGEVPELAGTSSLEKISNTDQVASLIESDTEIPKGKLPYFALLAVILFGVGAVYLGREKQ